MSLPNTVRAPQGAPAIAAFIATLIVLAGCQQASPPTITPAPTPASSTTVITDGAMPGSAFALEPVPTEHADGETQFQQAGRIKARRERQLAMQGR